MQVKRFDSKDENVSKYVFDFGNAVAEAVLYKYPTYEERTVICCSTMSGCPVGCRFCGAGDSFVRSLTAEEIVSQVLYLMAQTDTEACYTKKFQIMFMSMGEPMLNFKHLEKAVETLYLIYPNAQLLISTSGPRVDYKPLYELSKRIPTVGLQFSVHESTDAARDLLVPFRAKLKLEEIAIVGETWYETTGRNPFFNYCAHEGNTSDWDAERLWSLFDPKIWQATVSVICEREESISKANERQRELASGFMDKLLAHGYSVRCFDPAGQDDIGGGCGQLHHTQQWMKNNPSLAKPSIGRGKEIIHMPSIKQEILLEI